MPTKKTIDAAKRDKQEGKSASTQAGEFVKAEMDRIRKGQTGARNTKQAIAIGLSEARRAGVDLKPPAALSKQAKTAAQQRSTTERSASARKAAHTKGPAERSAAARKAANTRAQRGR
jgi:hypothetical protein